MTAVGPVSNIVFRVAVLALAGGLAACASLATKVQDKEQMLAAAGFLEKPANTPARQARLAALPPYKILSQSLQAGGKDTVGYVYADPQFCHCVYVGDPAAYQQFQQLAYQQRLQEEEISAAEMAQDDAFDWGAWGPYDYWGGGGVVVVRRGGHFR